MKNWRTTLIGLLTAVANTALPAMASGSVDWRNVGISAGIAALGYFAKDSNVTGA